MPDNTETTTACSDPLVGLTPTLQAPLGWKFAGYQAFSKPTELLVRGDGSTVAGGKDHDNVLVLRRNQRTFADLARSIEVRDMLEQLQAEAAAFDPWVGRFLADRIESYKKEHPNVFI